MPTHRIASALCALLLALPATAAADTSFLRLEGQQAGRIQGGVTQAGREGTILIVGFSHEIVSPRDAATGLPTGKRQHKPVSLRARLDKSSPLLAKALATNETMTEWKLDFFRPDERGVERLFFTVELTGAQVSTFAIETDEATGDLYMNVSFTYQKITWTWQDGGITAEDDWQTPSA